MTPSATIQIVVYAAFLVGLGLPLGAYMARVYAGNAACAQRAFGWLERGLYRLFGVKSGTEMSWQRYAVAVIVFNTIPIDSVS